MQPTTRRVPGHEGLEINVREWSTEGTPLVFVHGFSNDAHVWDDIAPVVAPQYRVLCLDLRGHGDSGRDPSAAYDADSMANDLECVFDALGIERLVLVGHSLGGRVAMRFAGRHPEKLAGLVIVDTGPEHDARGTTRISMDIRQGSHSFESIEEYERVLSRQYPVTPPNTLARLAKEWLRQREDGRYELKMDPRLRGVGATESPEAAAERGRAMSELLWKALARISCPTLVVRGAASDVLAPDTADRMVEETLARGRLAVVPQAGHSVMTDNPDGFREAVTSFVLADG